MFPGVVAYDSATGRPEADTEMRTRFLKGQKRQVTIAPSCASSPPAYVSEPRKVVHVMAATWLRVRERERD
jgi:hypothetical protein